ncbi:MAG: PQQ-dependent sugar dehydrogenase, partial [Opitutaceae bacterium]
MIRTGRGACWIVFVFGLAGAGLPGASKIEVASPQYQTAPAFGALKFHQPVQVVFALGETDRAFVAERSGRIVMVRDRAKPQREVFLDLSSRLNVGNNEGLLTFVFHPRFSENGFFYVWYSLHLNKGTRAARLSRFKLLPGNSG